MRMVFIAIGLLLLVGCAPTIHNPIYDPFEKAAMIQYVPDYTGEY